MPWNFSNCSTVGWQGVPTCGSGAGVDVALSMTEVTSATATVDFALSGSYKKYRIIYVAVPDTDAVNLSGRFSTDGGSSYADSAYQIARSITYSSEAYAKSESADRLILSVSTGSAANEEIAGECRVLYPHDASKNTFFENEAVNDQSTRFEYISSVGEYESESDVTHLRLFFSTGNIESGVFHLYGVN